MAKNMANKMLIYLGDLDHLVKGNRISMPLNIASIARYCKTFLGADADIRLFKDAQKLVDSIAKKPPRVLGLSYYMWNANLVKEAIKMAKLLSPSTITVIGGSSVSRSAVEYTKLLNSNSGLDIVVLDQAEKTFLNLMQTLSSTGPSEIFSESIPGCASRLKGSDMIVRGRELTQDAGSGFLNSFPSPYLSGDLDEFLEKGLYPLLETTRGCPYGCTYCGQSDNFFSRLYVKDEETVYKELLYILKHATNHTLCITDANFGIMNERDKRITLFMADLYKKHHRPFVTDFATSKLKSAQSTEVMKILSKDITGYFYFGLQTLTPSVLKNCKRENISDEKIKHLAFEAKKENLAINADLIFGLPGETKQSFLESISKILSMGIDQLGLYNLRLLPGTKISETDRTKFKYETRFRAVNNRYGTYAMPGQDKSVRIIEVEEIAYSSDSFDGNDFISMRKYGFLIELLVSYGALTETLLFLEARGLKITDLLEAVLNGSKNHPNLLSLMDAYEQFCRNELFVSEDELIKHICEDDKQWGDLCLHRGEYFKVNLGFVGYCLLENGIILQEIESILKSYFRQQLSGADLENAYEMMKIDKYQRIISEAKYGKLKVSDLKWEIVVKERFDWRRWKLNAYKGNVADYAYHAAVPFLYYITRYKDFVKAVEDLSDFEGFNFYERLLTQIPPTNIKRWMKKTTCQKDA